MRECNESELSRGRGRRARAWRSGVAGVLAAALVAVAAPAQAQSQADIVYVGGRYTARTDLDDRAGKREDRGLTVAIMPPSFELGQRDRLSIGVIYRYTGVDLLDGAAFANERKLRHLHAIDQPIAYSRILNRRWILTIGAIPGLRTDFQQKISERDIQVGGVLMATYLIGGDPHFKFSFGIFGQTHWALAPGFPFVALDYKNDFVAFDVGASGLNAVFRIGDRAEIGLFGTIGADWYHVKTAGAPQVNNARFLRLLELGVGPQVNVRTVGPVWLNARAGYNVLRNGTLGDADRKEIGGVSLDTSGAFFAQVGLSVRDPRR